jgi:hypothetical protein
MKRMVSYPSIGYCVTSRQSIDKQLFSYFPADPKKTQLPGAKSQEPCLQQARKTYPKSRLEFGIWNLEFGI